MIYENMTEGIFRERPNRFIAYVEIMGQIQVCHVKNTGRCRELLIPGARVLVQRHPDAAVLGRKTEYSLIGVYKETAGEKRLINMDSQAPNQAAAQWLAGGGLRDQRTGKPVSVTEIRREVSCAGSRFDLAFVEDGRAALMEVKGVTLERNGLALFPDAPTERGVKHLRHLAELAAEGNLTYIMFVIQMKGVTGFAPNTETHPEFSDALSRAGEAGVRILAYDCLVQKNRLEIDQPVPVLHEVLMP